jgi:hypothetical protein
MSSKPSRPAEPWESVIQSEANFLIDIVESAIERVDKASAGYNGLPVTLHRRLFRLARALQGVGLRTAADARPALRAFVDLLPIETWNDYLPSSAKLDRDAVVGSVLRAWPRVRYALGEGPFDRAVKQARAEIDEPWSSERYGYNARFAVRLCRVLSELASQDANTTAATPFFLAGSSLADVVGLSRQAASDILFTLREDRVIQLVERGGRQRGRRPKASSYIYRGDPSRAPQPDAPPPSERVTEDDIPF